MADTPLVLDAPSSKEAWYEELIHRLECYRLQSRFTDVSRVCEEAARLHPNDLAVLSLLALAKREQNQFGESLRLYEQCQALSVQQHADERTRARIQVGALLARCYVHGCLIDCASTIQKVFDQHVRGVQMAGFDRDTINLLTNIYIFRGLLLISGDEAYFPAPDLGTQFFRDLQQHLFSQRRWLEATRVANVSPSDRDDQTSHIKNELLQAVVDHPETPSHVKAFATECQAKYIREHLKDRDWVAVMQDARRRYLDVGSIAWANDTAIELMTRPGLDLDVEEATQQLWDMHATAKTFSYASGAMGALHALKSLYYDRYLSIPEQLQHKVNVELQTLYDLCQNRLSEAFWTAADISRWTLRGANAGQLRAALERHHQMLLPMKLNVLLSNSVQQLYQSYTSTGEHDKAAACLAQLPQTLTRRFQTMLLCDAFYKKVQSLSAVGDQDALYSELCADIDEATSVIQSTQNLDYRALEVQRLCNFPPLFMQLRLNDDSFTEAAKFSKRAIGAVQDLCQYLTPLGASQWQAQALQHEGLLAFQMSSWVTDEVEKKRHMRDALEIYKNSADTEWCRTYPQSRAFVLSSVASCHRVLWGYEGFPKVSRDFVEADNYFCQSKDMFQKSSNIPSQAMILRTLLQMWKLGAQAGVEEPYSPSSKILEYALEAEALNTLRRVDLSAIGSSQALLAKQGLRRNHEIQQIYDYALETLFNMQQIDSMWAWLQKSKSRGVSDMLALGINIPTDLDRRIAADDAVQRILQHEQELLQRIEDDQSVHIDLRRQLESLREEMRTNAVLKKVLDLREGRPTSLEDLHRVCNVQPIDAASPSRITYFIDWLILNNSIACFVASTSSSTIHASPTGVTLDQVQAWKAKYFEHHDDDDDHALHVDGEQALAELTSLVAFAVGHTQPGDLLVLCPAGVLHGIPLHAAYIDDARELTLIERNPIVYTSSMTTFEYCISRQLENLRHPTPTPAHAFIAVFERLETGALGELDQAHRDQIYAAITSIAASLPHASVLTGAAATHSAVARGFAADLVYFFGHCSFEPDDYLQQGLILHTASDTPSQPDPPFTAADMFDTRITASNVMLMACGSAMESHQQGDEPLGIITALICAGASSVTGTLWKVRTTTALAFTRAFHVALARERALQSGGGLIDLARAVQRAVCRLKARPETQAPLHWAAFVLHGSWFMGNRGGDGVV